MGVERTTYLLYGIKLDEKLTKITNDNKWDDVAMTKYIEGDPATNRWTLIYDGMCGVDHFFGKVMCRVEKEDAINKIDNALTDYMQNTEMVHDLLMEHFASCFGDNFTENEVVEYVQQAGLMMINHFY